MQMRRVEGYCREVAAILQVAPGTVEDGASRIEKIRIALLAENLFPIRFFN